MKIARVVLLIAGFMSACCAESEFIEERVCKEYREKEVSVCRNSSLSGAALVGALMGAQAMKNYALANTLGATIGANNSGTTRCHVESEKYCVEWITVKEPNPNFKKETR